MPNLSVKDVPETWAEALRQRAARNHRSLQGELMAILEAAVQHASSATSAQQEPVAGGARSHVVSIDRFGHPVTRQGWKTIEQVAAELRAQFPEPPTDAPLGVDIIRADRDSR